MDSFSHYAPPPSRIPFLLNKYHVFLSFRAIDVRKTLVDYISESLSAAGIHSFLDNERLEKGEDVGTSLEQAIEDTDIHIPIFSRNYLHSAWCLTELTHICKSKALIIPLFYDVRPSEVRRFLDDEESGYGVEAFKEHRRKGLHSPETIEEWKQALKVISGLSGWTVENRSSGFEGKLVKQIVSDIIKTLDKTHLHVAEHPVQLERKTQEVIRLLQLEKQDDVVTVGIWGMGGCGKTTIAKAVFNHIFHIFGACCFLSDVRNMSHKEFQEKIARDLHSTHDNRSHLQVSVVKRALVVLDDIDDSKQVECLTWENWAWPGSRMIVTTRDKHVLNMAQIHIVYKMEGLEYEEALRLFSWHAFLSPEPDTKYEQHSKRIVQACFGLPLAIEAAGDLLHDKKGSLQCWSEALSSPQSICHRKIYNVLKISYDNLTLQEKKIFVDIACFFRGKETERGILHWKRFKWDAHTAIRNLVLKSLISIGDDNTFMMHRLLRDMGEAIREADYSKHSWTLHCLRVSSPLSYLWWKFGTNKRLETKREENFSERKVPAAVEHDLVNEQRSRRLEVQDFAGELLWTRGFGSSYKFSSNLL